jgi:hypothetical protein
VTLRGYLDSREGELLWERVIDPYVVTDIPGCESEHQGRIVVTLTLADGTLVEA